MKNGIKALFSQFSLANIGFILIVGRIVVNGGSVGDAIALIAISALIGYNTFLNKKEDDWRKHIDRDIVDLKNALTSVKMNQNVKKMHSVSEKSEAKRFF